jgi:hypothetical protein
VLGLLIFVNFFTYVTSLESMRAKARMTPLFEILRLRALLHANLLKIIQLPSSWASSVQSDQRARARAISSGRWGGQTPRDNADSSEQNERHRGQLKTK